ncbi:MAG TPA: peptidoglycan DD-metalloendopeptidase family protein [Candidatus Limnocylindrales bacterium]
MTAPALTGVLATGGVPGSGWSAVVGRIGELDGLIRGLDPAWTGLLDDAAVAADATTATGPATGPAAASPAATGTTPTFALARPAAGGSVDPAADPPVAFRSPLPGATVSQPFGPTTLALEPPATVDGVRYAHFHAGVDLAAPLGTPVLAAAVGTVVLAGRVPDGAVDVRIRHADGSETLYGHLDPTLDVHVGDQVEAGQQLGRVGLTGATTGPHLHFALTRGGEPLDPAAWLAAGRLPGAAPAAGVSASTDGAADQAGTLARFDAVASTIPYATEIRRAAVSAGVDPLLLASLVQAESSFHPTVVSSAGAMGLTQLMPATARSLGVSQPFDPVQNLGGGARYLAEDLRAFGRVDLALAAYQAGKGAVRQYGGIPPYPSTQAYVRRILGTWAGYLEGPSA